MGGTKTILLGICLAIAAQPAKGQEPGDPSPPPPSVEERFRQWDRNGDGKLTPEEVPQRALFDRLDRDRDGVVTMDEVAGPGGQRPGPGRDWRSPGTSEGAPLPAAADFKPRQHGKEAAAAGLDPAVLGRIDVEMQRHVAAKNVAGIVALVHRQGHRGYFEAFGIRDIEAGDPMPRDAVFRLMSMTKPVIAIAALTYLDEGAFTLDEPIAKRLPEWKEPKVLENGALVAATSAITPRMLMCHSSGLHYGSVEGSGGAAALAYRALRGEKVTLKEFSEALAKEPLKFQPGTGYQYGHSIDVLGRYLEAVAGKPLDEVLKERLLGPLRMVDTDFWVPPAKAGRLAQLYRQPRPGVLEPAPDAAKVTEEPTLFLGGHGLCSTAPDYERLCRMVLNRGELDGVRVLKPETIDLMFENHLKVPGRKYGLGAMVDGEGGYAWGGADGTQFWIDRKNTLFGIFLVQTQGYRAPTNNTFRALVNEAAGVQGPRPGAAGGRDPLRERDTNGDGMLDRSELPGALFDRLDVDQDGFVTAEELSALWKGGAGTR